jgi:hypothetical protein
MIREAHPHWLLSAMTLDEVGAELRCDRCGKRPARFFTPRQDDARGVRKKLLTLRNRQLTTMRGLLSLIQSPIYMFSNINREERCTKTAERTASGIPECQIMH